MTTAKWYGELRDNLPHEFARYMDHEFPNWKREVIAEPDDFSNRVRDFIDEHIGRSVSDPLSIKVYSILEGKSEGEIYGEFLKKGYK